MTTKKDCKAVLFYWPIVARAETDIQAALQKLNDYEGMIYSIEHFNKYFIRILFMFYNSEVLSLLFTDKYAALVVLHHTFDPDTTVPDSSTAVKRQNLIVVDCLFHEDKGLLTCSKNTEAVKKVAGWLYDVVRSIILSPIHDFFEIDLNFCVFLCEVFYLFIIS